MSVSNDRSIFSQETWKELYPDSTNEKYKLHFLLANNSSIEQIRQCLKHTTKIDLQDEECYGLTPLHIAVMKSNKKAVKLLLDSMKGNAKAAVNIQDNMGWTALHHAYASEKIRRLLVASGADENIRSVTGATPFRIRQLTGFEKCEEGKRNLWVRLPDGNLEQCSQLSERQIKDLMQLDEWRDYPLYVSVAVLWRANPVNTCVYKEKLLKIWSDYQTRQPQLRLEPEEKLPGQFQIVAHEALKKHTAITSYSGINKRAIDTEFTLSHPKITFNDHFHPVVIEETSYLASPICALHAGNAARWINFGFPNVFVHDFTTDGFENLCAILTDDVDEGDSITYNYGAKYTFLTLGNMQLFGKERMEKAFANGFAYVLGQEKKLTKLKEMLGDKFNLHLELAALRDQIDYVWSCPIAMLYLWGRGLLTMQDAFEPFKKREPLMINFAQEHSFEHKFTQVFLQVMVRYEGVFNSKTIKPLICQWVYENCEKYSLPQMLKIIREMIKGTIKSQMTPENFHEYVKELEKTLANYDHNTDEFFIFSEENLAKYDVENLLNFYTLEQLLPGFEANVIQLKQGLNGQDDQGLRHSIACLNRVKMLMAERTSKKA